MPVVYPLRVPLSVEDVRAARVRSGRSFRGARIHEVVSSLVARINAGEWLQPAASYTLWPVAACDGDCIELNGGPRLQSPLAAHRLRRAVRVAAGVCTLGGALERQVREWFAAGEALPAVLLDEIGSLYLYRMADHLEAIIRREAGRLGLEASGVLNPGDDGFDLAGQSTVWGLAGGERAGISVTATGMLWPEKTLTLVMGLGDRMPSWTRAANCGRCRARMRCPYRQISTGARRAASVLPDCGFRSSASRPPPAHFEKPAPIFT